MGYNEQAMIKRQLENKIRQLAQKMPAIGILGPRQSGKTTLVREIFPNYRYVSLENLSNRQYASDDPQGFLADYSGKVIFDESQRAPNLFSYLQEIIDNDEQPGQFILTGSQHFLMLEQISQTLSGRIALLTLLPCSIAELTNFNLPDIEAAIFQGCYPGIYHAKLDPIDWYPNYIQTYVERDVRQIKQIHDLAKFHRFLKMCASRAGQLLNLSSLANDCGITHNTAGEWIAILEASFIVFRLQPYHNNFGKRLIKSPKLYFYDTGVVCSLLGLENKQQLTSHYLRGNLFENMVIAELVKFRYNQGKLPNLYFWRDQTGHEIDCLIESVDGFIPIEIKSSKTIVRDFFIGLKYLTNLAAGNIKQPYIIYGGDIGQQRTDVKVLSWRDMLSVWS